MKPQEGSTGESKCPAVLVWHIGGYYIALALPLPLITRCCPVPASSCPCWPGIRRAATQEAGIGLGLRLRGQGTGPGQLQAWTWEGWG